MHIAQTLEAFGHKEKISNKLLIIGGGNIGFNLAKNLEQEFEEARIKIIEKDKIRADGFEQTALNYSISSSASNKGNIGWVNSKALSKQIFNIIKDMKKKS